MVHSANRGTTQNLDSFYLHPIRRAKNVIDAPVVDRRIAGFTSKINEITQNVAIRFTVVFHIVGIEICFIVGPKLKVEISRYKDLG